MHGSFREVSFANPLSDKEMAVVRGASGRSARFARARRKWGTAPGQRDGRRTRHLADDATGGHSFGGASDAGGAARDADEASGRTGVNDQVTPADPA
jgi:hypothetical protein